jgi:hypothetical protein
MPMIMRDSILVEFMTELFWRVVLILLSVDNCVARRFVYVTLTPASGVHYEQ